MATSGRAFSNAVAFSSQPAASSQSPSTNCTQFNSGNRSFRRRYPHCAAEGNAHVELDDPTFIERTIATDPSVDPELYDTDCVVPTIDLMQRRVALVAADDHDAKPHRRAFAVAAGGIRPPRTARGRPTADRA